MLAIDNVFGLSPAFVSSPSTPSHEYSENNVYTYINPLQQKSYTCLLCHSVHGEGSIIPQWSEWTLEANYLSQVVLLQLPRTMAEEAQFNPTFESGCLNVNDNDGYDKHKYTLKDVVWRVKKYI